MRIVPVLDLLNGVVVRGVAGQRDQYRPIKSVLATGSDASHIAEAIRGQFGLTECYLADLDAILHGRPNLHILRSLSDAGFALMVDAGIRRCDDAAPILETGAHQVVAGLETLAGPLELQRLLETYGPERVVFSLDLRGGAPLGDLTHWPAANPLAIARAALATGCTQLIVLDIARVGTADGVPTLPLCREIRRASPRVTLITGGGIRGLEDLKRLKASSIDGVLIASALHNGSIGRADLDRVTW